MFRRHGLLMAVAAGLVAGAAQAAVDDKPPPSLSRPSAQAPSVVASWLIQHTGIAPASVVSVGDEYIVAVLSSRALDPAHPRVLHLEIRAEMTDPDSQTASILRSMSATLEINCAEHTSHFIEVRTFALPNLMGAEQVSHPSEGWVSNPRGSYFEHIDAAVCTSSGPRPLANIRASAPAEPAPTPVEDETPSAPMPPTRAPTRASAPVAPTPAEDEAPSASMRPTRAPTRASAPAAPIPAEDEAPSAPMRLTRAPNAPHPPANVRANAAPAPVLAEAHAPSAPLRPTQTPDAPLPHIAAPRPAPAPARQVEARSGSQAQIVAAPSQTKAQEALAALKRAEPSLMRGLSSHIERIERDGVTYYRALVSGFAAPMDATGFCRRLAASGRPCIAR